MSIKRMNEIAKEVKEMMDAISEERFILYRNGPTRSGEHALKGQVFCNSVDEDELYYSIPVRRASKDSTKYLALLNEFAKICGSLGLNYIVELRELIPGDRYLILAADQFELESEIRKIYFQMALNGHVILGGPDRPAEYYERTLETGEWCVMMCPKAAPKAC